MEEEEISNVMNPPCQNLKTYIGLKKIKEMVKAL